MALLIPKRARISAQIRGKRIVAVLYFAFACPKVVSGRSSKLASRFFVPSHDARRSLQRWIAAPNTQKSKAPRMRDHHPSRTRLSPTAIRQRPWLRRGTQPPQESPTLWVLTACRIRVRGKTSRRSEFRHSCLRRRTRSPSARSSRTVVAQASNRYRSALF